MTGPRGVGVHADLLEMGAAVDDVDELYRRITAAGVVVGVGWQLALLIGALLVVTGPTVIAPIVRQLRPTRRVSSMESCEPYQ